MKRNAYVQLASRSFVSLCDLASALEVSQTRSPRVNFVAEAVEETHRLWERLVWSDRSLNEHECAVFDAVAELAEECGGYRLVPAKRVDQAGEETREIPHFLRVASLCEDHGPRLAGRMINHLEAFGFGVLAADRQIKDAELADLQDYVSSLRQGVDATRLACRSARGKTVEVAR